jgi:hypothetical protein
MLRLSLRKHEPHSYQLLLLMMMMLKMMMRL